jgi:hypothetical protein
MSQARLYPGQTKTAPEGAVRYPVSGHQHGAHWMQRDVSYVLTYASTQLLETIIRIINIKSR